MLPVVADLVVAAGDLGLLLLAWRRRAALSAVAGVAGLGAALFASVAARSGAEGPTLLVAAVALGMIGTLLLVLGQAVQRLLDQTPEDEDGDAGGSPTN